MNKQKDIKFQNLVANRVNIHVYNIKRLNSILSVVIVIKYKQMLNFNANIVLAIIGFVTY